MVIPFWEAKMWPFAGIGLLHHDDTTRSSLGLSRRTKSTPGTGRRPAAHSHHGPTARKPTRVLIADDLPVVRTGLRAVLETEADIEVVGEAATFEETLAKTRLLRPDVIVLDIQMPRKATQAPGEARPFPLHEIRLHAPRARALVFSMLLSDSHLSTAMEARSGYVLKTDDLSVLPDAVRAVHEGRGYVSPSVQQYIRERIKLADTQRRPRLTPREWEILRLVVEGCSSREIARVLNIKQKTVSAHRSSIIMKTRCDTLQKQTKYFQEEALERWLESGHTPAPSEST